MLTTILVVDKSCVSVKLIRDQINIKKEICYKKHNTYGEENFDDKLQFDDIEAGMTIMVSFFYKNKIHIILRAGQKLRQRNLIELKLCLRIEYLSIMRLKYA